MLRTVLFASLITTSLVACGSDEDGVIVATAYGETFIEEGIPADVFADGWAISFDKFLVSVGDPKAKAGEDSAEVGDSGMYVVDLAKPSNEQGYELAAFAAPAGTYDHYGYRLAPAADAVNINADAADFDAFKAGGFSLRTVGSATRGAETFSFDWGFQLKLAYAHCEMNINPSGTEATMQSTIHADHLFYDDAVSPEPAVAFDIIADADGADGSTPDGVITMAELAATDIRGETRYQVGSNVDVETGAAIENLKQYLTLQVTTVGHINGEGHCEDVIVTP